MSDERFEKYVKQVVSNTDPEDFLRDNRNYIANLKNDSKSEKEFNYYKALSNKLRFYMFKLLQERPMCTCALAKLFNKPESVINHHLTLLETYGLLKSEKEGYFTIYHPVRF